MKKIYIRPEASVIRLCAEASLMSISKVENGSNDDSWSNQREWTDADASFGADED